MKLTPPIVKIVEDDPYRYDLFQNREAFGSSLYSLFESSEDGSVVCVDAPWGEGKTTFARMWEADLLKRGVRCTYFDAYENDYADDPFIGFCGEIVDLANNLLTESEEKPEVVKEFSNKAKKLGGAIITTSVRVGIKALSLGSVSDTDIEEFSDQVSNVSKSPLELATDAIGDAIDGHTNSKKALREFKEQLEVLGKAVRDEQGFPLVIIIDELDRCRPDYALKLIERIKHLFLTDHVSFLLLTNISQLQNYVRAVYGNEVDAVNYLHKFINFSAQLPRDRGDVSESDYIKYTTKLLAHFFTNEHKLRKDIHTNLASLFQHYELSLREIDRFFVCFSLYFTQFPDDNLSDNLVIAFLVLLQIRNPDVLRHLETKSISFKDLDDETGVGKIPKKDYHRFRTDWLVAALQFYLFSTEELDNEASDSFVREIASRFTYRAIERQDVIPILISRLTQFKTIIR
jgi:hypothetical protein